MSRFLPVAALAAILAAAGFGFLAQAATTGAATPNSDALLAAGLSAADLQAEHLPPGGWFDTDASFYGNYEPGVPPQLLNSVYREADGGVDKAPTWVGTVVTVYSDPQGAAADFARRAPADQKNFGDIVAGPKLGDEDRYMRLEAKQPTAPGSPPEEPILSLRVIDGRYGFRIEADGEASKMSPETLAGLAHIVMGRLATLDAGKLTAPALPADAAVLPDPDSEFNPIMGSATLPIDAQAWTRPTGATEPVFSPRLRDLLQRGVGDARIIKRQYALAAHHGQVVAIMLIPFKTPDAAEAFETANQQLSPPSPGARIEDNLTISVPTASEARYKADFRRGRYAFEVVCSALFGDAVGDCEGAVRDMAGKLTARVAAQPAASR